MLLESLKNDNTKKTPFNPPAFFTVLNKCTNTD